MILIKGLSRSRQLQGLPFSDGYFRIPEIQWHQILEKIFSDIGKWFLHIRKESFGLGDSNFRYQKSVIFWYQKMIFQYQKFRCLCFLVGMSWHLNKSKWGFCGVKDVEMYANMFIVIGTSHQDAAFFRLAMFQYNKNLGLFRYSKVIFWYHELIFLISEIKLCFPTLENCFFLYLKLIFPYPKISSVIRQPFST